MRLVVQRVGKSRVLDLESNTVVGEIQKGLLVLVGVGKGDNLEIAEQSAEKIFNLRIFSDVSGKINLSIKDVGGEVLAISQFTLYADVKRGNRPSFQDAEVPEKARKIYFHFVNYLRKKVAKLETGEFGAHMQISTKLEGPVTIIV